MPYARFSDRLIRQAGSVSWTLPRCAGRLSLWVARHWPRPGAGPARKTGRLQRRHPRKLGIGHLVRGVHGGPVRHRLVFGDPGRGRCRRRTVLVREGQWILRLLVCRSGGRPASACRGRFRDLGEFFAKADAKSAAGAIDSLELVRRQKIYVFHGYNDAGWRGRSPMRRRSSIATISARPTAAICSTRPRSAPVTRWWSRRIRRSTVSTPARKATAPFIDQCGYDQAGIILQHIYGALNDRRRGPLTGTIKPFDQSVYTSPNDPGALSLGQNRLRVRSPGVRARRGVPRPYRLARLQAECRRHPATLHRSYRLQCLGRYQSPDRGVSADGGEPVLADQSAGVLGLVGLLQLRRQLRDQIRRAGQDHQGDARRADGRRCACGRRCTGASGGAELSRSSTGQTHRWRWHGPRNRERRLPRPARRRRRAIRGGGRCDRSKLRRFRD